MLFSLTETLDQLLDSSRLIAAWRVGREQREVHKRIIVTLARSRLKGCFLKEDQHDAIKSFADHLPGSAPFCSNGCSANHASRLRLCPDDARTARRFQR